jgi:hypothetical protein
MLHEAACRATPSEVYRFDQALHVDIGRHIGAGAGSLRFQIPHREVHAGVIGPVDLVPQALQRFVPAVLRRRIGTRCQLFRAGRTPAALDAVVRIERQAEQPVDDVAIAQRDVAAGRVHVSDRANIGRTLVCLAQIAAEVEAVVGDALIALHPHADQAFHVVPEGSECGLQPRIARRRGVDLPLHVVGAVDVRRQAFGVRLAIDACFDGHFDEALAIVEIVA